MTCHAADCSGSAITKREEKKTSATARGFALATRGIKCHIKNNARIRVTNYTSLLDYYFRLQIHIG